MNGFRGTKLFSIRFKGIFLVQGFSFLVQGFFGISFWFKGFGVQGFRKAKKYTGKKLNFMILKRDLFGPLLMELPSVKLSEKCLCQRISLTYQLSAGTG